MALEETRILIDANIFVSFLNEADSEHDHAQKEVSMLEEKGAVFIVLDHVIQETLTVLLYKYQGTNTHRFWNMIEEKSTIATIDTSLLHLKSALDLASQSSFQPKLSLTDWLLLFLSKHWQIPLLTFDKQLKNAASYSA